MNFFVKWKTYLGTRKVVLHNWNDLDHLVNVLKVKEFSIEVFEYTEKIKC